MTGSRDTNLYVEVYIVEVQGLFENAKKIVSTGV